MALMTISAENFLPSWRKKSLQLGRNFSLTNAPLKDSCRIDGISVNYHYKSKCFQMPLFFKVLPSFIEIIVLVVAYHFAS